MLGKSQTSASSSGFHPFLFWTSSFLFLGSVFLPFRLLNSQTFYQSFLIFPFFVPDDPLFEEDISIYIPLQNIIVMIQNYHSEGVCHSRFSLPMLFHRSYSGEKKFDRWPSPPSTPVWRSTAAIYLWVRHHPILSWFKELKDIPRSWICREINCFMLLRYLFFDNNYTEWIECSSLT